MVKVAKKTPAELGYWMPPEWHPHEATWVSWPRPEGVSFPGRYHAVPANMANVVRQIAAREPVHICVPNVNCQRIARQHLTEHGCPSRNIHFHFIRTNEPWCRDHGPAFVIRRKPKGGMVAAVVDWDFNAWGGKYPPYDDDDAVPTHIADELGLSVFYPEIVMEGGAVDFNGLGTVLTTESCLLNRNRNPRLTRTRIEQYLKDYYGQKHVVWLGKGIAGDDTDGHIDDLARFINPHTIVAAVEQDPTDANYKVLRENLKRLRATADQDGWPFNIVELPMPRPVHGGGQRLPASYLNFYFVNGALLVPTFRCKKKDAQALAILQEQLPEREVIGIDCVELIWGLGAIHCLTQQQPRV